MRADVQRELVERARRGDHEAFAVLARTASPRLSGAAQLILRDPERAKDALQDAFIRAWRDLGELRDPDRFDAWLYRLLVRACFDELRRGRRRPVEIDLTDQIHPLARDEVGELVERDALQAGLRRLDVEGRSLIVLHYYVGLPLPEVAEVLGIPLGTAKSRLHRATLTLRSALGGEPRSVPAANGGVA